jgi:hypothetical protein
MNEKKMKRLPYGLSDYERLVQRNCYYVDKTLYLREIEEAGDYLFFIRPRRFGKSLFLSMMEAYYDVRYKDRFEELFKDTAIFNQPTEERGTYLVLSNLYIIHPEKELNKGYADIVMEPFLARYEEIKYSYLLEIKYIKTGVKPKTTEIDQLKAAARQQLENYSLDEKFRKNIEKTTLIKLVLIFSGHELIYIGEAA